MAAKDSGALSWFERVLKVGLRHMLSGRPTCRAFNERVQVSKNISLSTHNTGYDGIIVSDGEDLCLVLDRHTAPLLRVN